jgi:uncharacterized membrane protein YfcA
VHYLPYLVVAFAVLLIGVTKSGFGAGTGLIIVPITALGMAHIPAYGEQAALGLLLPLLCVGDLIALLQYRKLLDARLLKLLLLPTLLGVIVGSALLWGIEYVGGHSKDLAIALIRLEIGLECIILVGLHYYGQAKGAQRRLMPEPRRSWLTGSYCGVSSTLAHAAGPIIALYLIPLSLPREVFVGTCAAYFCALNTVKLPAYFAAGMFSKVPWTFSAMLLPLVFLGALLGRWMVRKVNDKLFGKIIYASTMAMGAYLIGDAGWRLFTLK